MWLVIWLQPFIAAAGLVLAHLAAAGARRWWRGGAHVAAGLAALSAVALTAYVASEDDYRHDGRSRWVVYDAQELSVAAIAASAAAAIVLPIASRRPHPGRRTLAALLTSAAGALTFVAFLANTLN